MKQIITLVIIVCLVSCCSNTNMGLVTNHRQIQTSECNSHNLDYKNDQITGVEWTVSGDTLHIYSDLGMNSWMDDFHNKHILADITHIEIWPGVTAINEAYPFAYQDHIVEEIIIPYSVKQIEVGALRNIKTIIMSTDNPFFTLENNCLVRNEDMAVIYCNLECEIVSIPEGVKAILGAFTDNKSVKVIHVPDTVRFVSQIAFAGCDHLESIDFSKTSSIYFDELSFYNSGLKELILPEQCYLAGAYAEDSGMFGENLQRLIITGKDTNIEFKDFCTAKGLRQIIFLCEKPSKLDDEAFIWCDPAIVIYYDKQFSQSWAPNGEMKWNGIPIIGINNMLDLEPIIN